MAIKKYFVLCFFLCTACSNSAHFDYHSLESQKYRSSKIHLRNISLSLHDRTIWPVSKKKETQYLSIAQMEEILREEIIRQLQEDKIYSNDSGKDVLECDFQITFDRMFMMFTNHAYIGTALRNYEIEIYKNDLLVAKKFDSHRKTAQMKFGNRLKKIGKEITFTYDRNEEIKEVRSLAHELANNLEEFGI